MIAFLDQSNQILYLYSQQGVQQIPFDSIDELEDILGSKRILYVTKAVQANAASVIKLVRSLEPEPSAVLPGQFYPGGNAQRLFLRSTAHGPVHLAALDIAFAGPGDCKEIDEHLQSVLVGSMDVQELIRNKHLEIIDEKTMRRLSRKHGRELNQRQAKIQSAKDKELESIIVQDKSAADAADASDDIFDGSNDLDISDLTP